MNTARTSTEDRALALLGQGLSPEIVASAVGVSASRISQLLSDTEFATKVAEARYENLAKHNERDNKYDILEDKFLDKMEDLLPFMMKPMEVLKALSVINAAKRRGSSAPDSLIQKQQVVPLIMPTQIIQQFTTNINNQVVKAGEQELITVQSSRMQNLLESKSKKGNHDVSNALPGGNQTLAAST